MSQITIGTNIFRDRRTTIIYKEADRFRHLYMLGKTGVGKSSLFQNACLQDILAGHGTCFIDPHGDSVRWLIEHIPQNRLEDVIFFNPADTNFPFGLNLLEPTTESDQDFLVSHLVEIFYALFDPTKSGIIGPQFEHWLRCAALTVMADPSGGNLLEIPKLFVDKKFEQYKKQFVRDPHVLDFWNKQMANTADFHKSEMLNYFTSKFGHFQHNRLMRNILGQTRSAFNFDRVMQSEKILLIDLSKGKIGDTNAYMLGLILMTKLQAAVLRRANVDPIERYPFYVYVDEFQNMVTDAFASLLSESRKYGLGLHLTNQYFSQLPKKIQEAIMGNIGTFLTFEVGAEDAEKLEPEFAPMTREDFLSLPRFHFFIKLMLDGKTSRAFSGISHNPNNYPVLKNNYEDIQRINRLAYGLPRELVEANM